MPPNESIQPNTQNDDDSNKNNVHNLITKLAYCLLYWGANMY